MKNIYFVQAGNLYGNNAHLPYAAGCVAAHAWSNPRVREAYKLADFLFLRRPVEEALAAMEAPFMMAFSNYVWNFEYHKALARAVKARFPGCLVVFGGHHVRNESAAQLEELPYVDFLIHRGGEVPFERLLLALREGEDLSGVPSLSYRGTEGLLQRTEDAPCEHCGFPSPYLCGMFDGLFERYPQLCFSMTIETNRGCPHYCAYCDWGAVRHSLHVMPMRRVKAEIDWAAAHEIEFVLCADANFGILERDEEIVDYLIESKERCGYPKKIRACLTKDSDAAVFRLNEKLSAHGLHNGAALSFQSMSPVVHANIGRESLDFERYRELIGLYLQADVPVYTELILGLPGETLQSFAQGIGKLLAAGLHGALEIFRCELLPNAELASESYREQHGVKAVRVEQHHRHESPGSQGEIPEYTELVVATDSMPVEDWIAANVFSDFVQGLHCLGLTPCCAIYLHRESGLAYEQFYFDMMQHARAQPATLLGELLSFCEGRYRALSQGAGESIVWHDPRFGEIAWPLGSAVFLRAAYESARFYAELPAFLWKYAVHPELLVELIAYQRAMLCLPEPSAGQQSFAYDFPGYFAGTAGPPAKRRTTITFPAEEGADWPEFAREFVWYGRRKGALRQMRGEVSYERGLSQGRDSRRRPR